MANGEGISQRNSAEGEPPRAITATEARARFLRLVQGVVARWGASTDKSASDVAEGAIMELLGLLDGNNLDYCGIHLALAPAAEDADYDRSTGTNWFEAGQVINRDVSLVEQLYAQVLGVNRVAAVRIVPGVAERG